MLSKPRFLWIFKNFNPRACLPLVFAMKITKNRPFFKGNRRL